MERIKIKIKSIKGILIESFLAVILSTTLILDFMMAIFVKKYNYNDIEELLKNQINIAINFYEKYFPTSSLEENIYDNVDIFWNQTNAEVQIFNMNGELLMDSIGVNDNNIDSYPDIKNIINNLFIYWWLKIKLTSAIPIVQICILVKFNNNASVEFDTAIPSLYI